MARLDPRRARRAPTTWPLQLAAGEVTLRRCDLMNQVLTGRFEARLMYAAQKMEEALQAVQAAKAEEAASAIAALDAVPAEEREAFIEVLRLYACTAIADPVHTLEDDGIEEHMPVALLTVNDLLLVWGAKPPSGVAVDPDQPLAAPATEEGAARFPAAVAAAHVAEPAAPQRDDAPPRVDGVAVQTVRLADARVVEFAQA